MIRFEYKTLMRFASDDELDRYGAVGWELVAVTEIGNIRYYFKRPLPAPDDALEA